jgi:hypothetical protein
MPLDKCLRYSYIGDTRSVQDAFREGIPEWWSECGARGREDTVRSRAAWASVCRHYDRRGRCSLDWDRRRWVTPIRPRPRKPGLKLNLWMTSPQDESRGGTPTGERARLPAAAPGGCGRFYPTPVGVPLPFASVVKGRRERPLHSSGVDVERIDLTARKRKTRCGNEEACFILPRESGGGGPREAWWRGRLRWSVVAVAGGNKQA